MTQLAPLLPASQNNLTHLTIKTDILFSAKTHLLLIGGTEQRGRWDKRGVCHYFQTGIPDNMAISFL